MVRAGGGQINEQKEVIITEATAKHRSGASTDGDEVAQSVSQSDSSPPRGVLDPLRPVCSSLVERGFRSRWRRGEERTTERKRKIKWPPRGNIHREMHINVRCRDIQKVDQSVACMYRI